MLLQSVFLTATLACMIEAAFYYPNLQTSLLEHILVDNWGAYASNFSSAITPCSRYVTQIGGAAVNSGRTTAAQWMRVLFHDFITANVTAGTGGVDASIGFETNRAENSGSAFNDSFTFWRPFVNGAVSSGLLFCWEHAVYGCTDTGVVADLIALGTVMSNNLCGGNNLPYRPGRVDATAAGSTTGVPAPETSLDETLLFFERAGFNSTAAIGITACGHTLGSVHHGGFPDVVDTSFVSLNNTNGGSNFDSTRGVFDPAVVGEYLSWTGRRGGPLVTSNNETVRSDLRLYESDKNATMRDLFAQGHGFLDTCVDLLGQAMNTVPSGVHLGEVVSAMGVKPINTTYDFDSDGKLRLSGKIRALTPASAMPPRSLKISISGYDLDVNAEAETGSSVFGRRASDFGITTHFAFALSESIIREATSFSVAGESFAVSSKIFAVPSFSTMTDRTINATIAVVDSDSCIDLSVKITIPIAQTGTLAPKTNMKQSRLDASSKIGQIDGYTLCSTSWQLNDKPTGAAIISVLNQQKSSTSCYLMEV